MVDYKILLPVIVFLGAFAFIQTQFNTEYITSSMNYDYSSNWNGTIYSNLTTLGNQTSVIPMPPSCDTGAVVIDGVLGCLGGYMGYYYDIMTFRTDTAWLNTLILIPILVLFALFVILLLIEVGKIVADLIPFT